MYGTGLGTSVNIRGRADLPSAQRVVIKAGTSVVSTPEGYISLTRIANIVESAAKLVRMGKEVLVVTSGAVGVGRQRLRKQSFFRQSMSDLLIRKDPSNSTAVLSPNGRVAYNSACAAAGQLELMSLYETMFSQWDIPTSQMLVTAFDFTSAERRANIQYVLSQLLALGIVPIINENDAVSANQGYQLFGNTFSDNDSLAALISIEMKAHLTILLTDVNGVYDRPPNEPGAQVIDVFTRKRTFREGDKSLQGRGGMGAKVDAALRAVQGGVLAAVIGSGSDFTVVDRIMNGEPSVGTLFLHCTDNDTADSDADSVLSLSNPPSACTTPALNSTPVSTSTSTAAAFTPASDEASRTTVQAIAAAVRAAGRQLQQASADVRNQVLMKLADLLVSERTRIMAANAMDIAVAEEKGLTTQLISRLRLTDSKLDTLVSGIRSIAEAEDVVGRTLTMMEVADKLLLRQVSCPIGCLLVIFESRPDCLAQIASLAIKSANGLILKGGSEAQHSNVCLHSLVVEALTRLELPADSVVLVDRSEIPELLKADDSIDLVIPRGSNALVKYIKANTSIPVLGHADGVCHIYIDAAADIDKAERIIVDAKTSYPSACNAVETILIHESLVDKGDVDRLLRALRKAGVAIFGGPSAMLHGLTERAAESMKVEYGDMSVTVEVVSSAQAAIAHINRFSSGHTESIVTESESTAKRFLSDVDSACVFHNASTRFADGYRFGLGAEVGISTGRVHARGPVGVEGLLTSKWLLTSTSETGHTVSMFSDEGHCGVRCEYKHAKC